MATLSLTAVTRSFQRRNSAGKKESFVALGPLDVLINDGEFVALIGPSGSGKSTVLRLFAGLDMPSTGLVQINARPPRDLQRRQQLGIAFQEHALLPWRTVE